MKRELLYNLFTALFVLSLIGGGKPECHDRRIAHSREHLEELSARVKELSI